MEKNRRIKILISYHKEGEMIKSEIMMPIQVGVNNSAVNLKIQCDNDGINISDKNDKYCELTAQYWAWKNLDTDFYGFMHYRRHFVFRDVKYSYDDGRPLSYKCINHKYREEIGLYDAEIYSCIEGYDLILPLPVDTSSWGAASNEIQFSCLENLHAIDFDMVCNMVTELYPDYYNAVQTFRTSKYAHWFNMFIMKRDLFLDYSQWLFHVLERSEKRIDFTKYDQQESRTLAFMAERLLSIYVIKLLMDRSELKVKHLKMTFVHYTDKGSCLDEENIEVPNKKYAGVDYVCSVKRAYMELKKMSLPYDLKDLFQIEDKVLGKLLIERKIIFYGGGGWCEQFLSYFDELGIDYPIEIWDREAEKGQEIRDVIVVQPQVSLLPDRRDNLWIITIRNEVVSNEVKKFLKEYGVECIVENRALIRWLSYKLWLSVNCENKAQGGNSIEAPGNFSRSSSL